MESEQLKINQGMKKIIEENALGLATIGKDNKPHNIAVAYVKVVSDNELVISNNYINETIENIKQNPNISLVVWNKCWEENCMGYELNGTAEYYIEGIWYDLIKTFPINEGEPCKGAILVKVNKIKVLI